MSHWKPSVVTLITAFALTACGPGKDPAEKAAQGAAERAEPSPLAQEAPAPVTAVQPATAIATGSGPEGSQVSLVKARITGNVLTVELAYRNPDPSLEVHYFDVDQVSVIDDATSQRYGVLKDNTGSWMAAPLYDDRRQIRVETSDGEPAVVWFKFPAPPASSSTVSINVPDVSPFDGVAVQR